MLLDTLCLKTGDAETAGSFARDGGAPHMLDIYVSSTFKDLRRCRRKVEEAIQLLGHRDVAMEYYGAESRRPLEKCLGDVARCGVYVGIFARRYGWIPPRETSSITELEFRQAIRCRKDMLLFLLRDEVARWPGADDEASATYGRLIALRGEIATGEHGMPSSFSGCDELAVRVTAAIANLVAPPQRAWDPAREEDLFARVDSADVVERSGAAEALVDMGSALYAAHLRQRLKDRRLSGERREKALSDLLEIENRNGHLLPMLLHLLAHGQPQVRARAVAKIGNRTGDGQPLDAEIVRAVLARRHDEDARVRFELAHALPKMSWPGGLRDELGKCLIRLTRDPDANVKRTAAQSHNRLHQQGIV